MLAVERGDLGRCVLEKKRQPRRLVASYFKFWRGEARSDGPRHVIGFSRGQRTRTRTRTFSLNFHISSLAAISA